MTQQPSDPLTLRREMAIFLLALQFLTRLPVPKDIGYSEDRMAAAPRYYALVGGLVGALCAAVYALGASGLSPLISAILAVAAGLLITGAFHEDGLADTWDGIGGGATREKSLEIMRDSRIGTYGAAALAISLLLQAACLAEMPERVALAALIIGHSLSRLSAVAAIATSGYARDHGTGKHVADGISNAGLAAAALGAALWCLLAFQLAPDASFISIVAGLAIGHIAMRLVYQPKLGGYTGDCLGAVQQVSLIGIYLGVLWGMP